MRVRAVANCDAVTDSGKVALFRGQEYDLPPEVARSLADKGLVEAVSAKSVKGPPSDKALSAREATVPEDTKPVRRRK